jgi:hypothetical protein
MPTNQVPETAPPITNNLDRDARIQAEMNRLQGDMVNSLAQINQTTRTGTAGAATRAPRPYALWPAGGDPISPAPPTLTKKPPVKERKVPATIQEQYGIRAHTTIAKLMEQHKGEQIMGVELEIENFPVPVDEATAVGMDFTTDGSLRNSGVEAITRPNHPAALLNIIKAMWAKYEINEKNFSDRTSIHVHCNVLHFTADQIKTLVILYSLTEEILFDFVGGDRRDSIFCVPWYDAGVHTGNYNRVWTNAADWQKYTALNLQPVATQGSVEFRHMYGHANFEVLTNWLTILKEFMSTAEHGNSTEIYKRVMELNTSSEYASFLRQVFPTTADILMTNSPNWEQHLIRGVIEAKLSTI